MTLRVLLATRSQGKLRELRPMFAAAGSAVMDLEEAGLEPRSDEESVECFDSFEENARAKARYFHLRSGGRPTVADDSGLEVEALAGRPGVLSKRWSGRRDLTGLALDEANNVLLLDALRGVTHRAARYVCVACYVDADREVSRRGIVEGWIADAPAGAEGFGYDPYFISRELGRSFGMLSRDEKAGVSHRGRAVRALLHALRDDGARS